MKREYWEELALIFEEDEKLKEDHQELNNVINLIAKSVQLDKEQEELRKELDKLNK